MTFEFKNIKGASETQMKNLISVLKNISEDIFNNGGCLYVVGGAIRDSLLGKAPKDIDLEFLNIKHEKVFEILETRGFFPQYIGNAFGIILINIDGFDIEIAPARTEQKIGSTHQDFTVSFNVKSVEKAAKRRDLTINALYYDLLQDKLIDTVGGLNDIENKVLRPTSDAFGEDSLRIFRAARYLSTTGFEASDKLYTQALIAMRDIDEISNERIRMEFEKVLNAEFSSKGLKFLSEINALKRIIPSLEGKEIPFERFDCLSYLDGFGLLLYCAFDTPNNPFLLSKFDFNSFSKFKSNATTQLSIDNLPYDFTREEKRIFFAQFLCNEFKRYTNTPLGLAYFRYTRIGEYELKDYVKNVLEFNIEFPSHENFTLPDELISLGVEKKKIGITMLKGRFNEYQKL